MSWTNYFDKIFLVNLPEREDRFEQCKLELGKYNIPFMLFTATKCENGAQGIYETMKRLFKYCSENGIKKALVFEDDVKFLIDPSLFMYSAIAELPTDFDMLYLGCNVQENKCVPYSATLLQVLYAQTLHAVAYSENAMIVLAKLLEKPYRVPIDRVFPDALHKKGKSFCTNPLLATQRAGYSDILKKEVNYSRFIEERFEQNVKNKNG